MRLKTVIDEDFLNFKVPSMFIGCVSCDGKCARDGNFDISICQNDEWRKAKIVDVSDDDIIRRYLANDITKSIVFGLLEPFEQFIEVFAFISLLREKYNCSDPVVIYTGYNADEIAPQIEALKSLRNIVVKFGRFQLGDEKHFDPTLGVFLASDNQYAEWIS